MITEDSIRQRFKQGEQFNFAACRLPFSDTIYFFYSDRPCKLTRLQYQADSRTDFIFSHYAAGNQAYHMQASLMYKNDAPIYGWDAKLMPVEKPLFTTNNFEADENFYKRYVSDIITDIEQEDTDKVVAARALRRALPDSFSHSNFFFQLLQQYPHAMVYYVNHAEWGCWCGATPEMLLTATENKLQTMSLAGTMPAHSKEAWGEKELQEQAMVTDFIEQIFEKYQLTIQINQTSELVSGKIKHLCTQLESKTDEEWLTQKFHKLLADLNPTPAVCGIPQFNASVFIGKHEKLERRFYSGFLGISAPKHIQLYVNLRCMEIGLQDALLYAGAGITAYSSPTKEWQETINKLMVLGSIINDV